MSAPTRLQSNSVQYYLNLIGDIPRLSKDDEIYLSKMALQGDKLARHELVRGNLKLVIFVAKRVMGRGLPLLDLIQEGNLGLMRAAETFDGERGFKFSTYAYNWIRRWMLRAIEDKGRIIRLPVHLHDHVRLIIEATKYFEELNFRKPTVEELAELSGLEQRKIEHVLKHGHDAISLETVLTDSSEDGETKLEGMLSYDDHNHIDDIIINREVREAIKKTLTTREQKIINLRYGIGDGKDRTLDYIGKKIGLTRERIRQIIVHALAKLEHNSACLS